MFNVLNEKVATNRAICVGEVFGIPLVTFQDPTKLKKLYQQKKEEISNYFIVVRAYEYYFKILYNPFYPVNPNRIRVYVYLENPLLNKNAKLVVGTFNSGAYIGEYERIFKYIDGVSLVLPNPTMLDVEDDPSFYSTFICEDYLLFSDDEKDHIHFELMDRYTNEVLVTKIPFSRFIEEDKKLIVVKNDD